MMLLLVTSLLHWSAAMAPAAPAGGSERPPAELVTRGYVELFAEGRDLADSPAAEALGPGVDAHRALARADLALDYQNGGWRLFAELFGSAAFEEGGSSGRLYQGWAGWTRADRKLFLRAGKAGIGWGAATVWNPVRTIEQQKDLLFSDTALEGEELAEVRFYGDRGNLAAIQLPERTGERGALWALRGASSVGDVSLALSTVFGEDADHRFGLEVTGVVGPVAWVGEALYRRRSPREFVAADGERRERGAGSYLSWVLGGNVTLPADVLVVLEHYHDDEGDSAADSRRLRANLAENGDLFDPLGRGRDRTFLGVSKRLFELDGTLAANLFYDAASDTRTLQLRLEAHPLPDFQWTAVVLAFDGPGRLDRRIYQLRLRWSF
jgi:hypothetical protein